MKVGTMADQKNSSVDISTPTVVQPAIRDSSKKYKIALGVLGAVTILAVVAAFVAVFQIYSNSVDKVIKHLHVESKDDKGHRFQEDIEVDETDNIARFTVRGEDGRTFQVIEDFARKLTVMKLPGNENPTCLVSILNTAGEAKDLPDVMENPSNATAYFVQDPHPIPNPDFLSVDAQAMCEGHNVYWSTESCDGNMPEHNMRVRRAPGGRWVRCRVCYIAPCGCRHCHDAICYIEVAHY